jgi:hypothetical protein
MIAQINPELCPIVNCSDYELGNSQFQISEILPSIFPLKSHGENNHFLPVQRM